MKFNIKQFSIMSFHDHLKKYNPDLLDKLCVLVPTSEMLALNNEAGNYAKRHSENVISARANGNNYPTAPYDGKR